MSDTRQPRPAAIEHRWTWEHRSKVERRPWGANDVIVSHRKVCACGWATSWFHNDFLAESQSTRHAMPGQQTLL